MLGVKNMKKMMKKFGKLITASFIIMGIGIVTFPLVIPMYGLFGIDTDWFSFLIFLIGLVVCIVGVIHRKSLRVKLGVALVILVSILGILISIGVGWLIYILIRGNPYD